MPVPPSAGRRARKPKGGCMNEVCMLTASRTPNQIRSIPSFSATGPSSGTTMNESSKKSRKKASRKIRMLTTIRKPICPPGRSGEQVLDPEVAIDAVEGQRKDARADQDEDDEGGQLGGRFHRLLEQRQGQAFARHGHDQRAGGAHGAAFGRRGDAEEDGAEDQEDQQQRRHQRRQRRAAAALLPCSVRASGGSAGAQLRLEERDEST
jgi:hypothetical protein